MLSAFKNDAGFADMFDEMLLINQSKVSHFRTLVTCERLLSRRRRTALSVSCPCLVFVRISGRSCPVSVCCPDSVRILSVSILSAVRILSGL